MDRAVIRALLFPLCTWVLYGFQPKGVRLPDALNLRAGASPKCCGT